MSLPQMLLLAVAAIASGWLLTRASLALALRLGMIDRPGARSSHTVPTPRGGGLSIVLCTILGSTLLWCAGWLDARLLGTVAAGGGTVALAGWLEDWRGVPILWRAGIYLGASLLAVIVLAGLPAHGVAAWTGFVLAVLGTAWLTNLYNFMDGTDGLAAVQCIAAAAFAAYLFLSAGAAGPGALAILLGGSAGGFLYWNRPPARVFMGDAGSCFTGFTFGVLAVAGETTGTVPAAALLILLGVFVIDASLTLARRVLRGERWYSPHRTHAYQLLVRGGLSHGRLALGVAAVTALLLGPLALWGAGDPARLTAAAAAAGIGLGLAWAAVQARLLPRETSQRTSS